MWESLLYGLSMILWFVIISLFIVRLLKQPMIIGYILAGSLISIFFPRILWWATGIDSFWTIGITFLLFMVGMELHPRVIKEIWRDAIIAWFSQVIITSVVWFLLSRWLGIDVTTSLYIWVGFSFSSTIVILKILSDMGKTDSLFWRLSVGILVVQDLIVMLVFLALATTTGFVENWWVSYIFILLLKFVALCGGLYLVSKYAIPKLIKNIAKSQEFLFLFAIARCFIIGSLFHYLWFSMEIGALLAWISLATSDYRFEMMSKIKTLRDFFIVIFFVLLWSHVHIESTWSFWIKVWVFSLFILVIKPLIIDIILWLMWHTKKNTFLSAISLGQISEFSFLLIALGITNWLIKDQEILSVITLVGLITIAVSSYFILHGEWIYSYFRKYMKYFPWKWHRKYTKNPQEKWEIVIFWYGKFGHRLYESLKEIHNDILIIDENPAVITHLKEHEIDCKYWDMSDVEFLQEVNISGTKMIVSTISKYEDNVILLENIKNRYKNIIVVLIAENVEKALDLYDKGADYVILPHYIWANHTSLLLEEYWFDISKFITNKNQQVSKLQNKHQDLIIEALQKF